MPRLTLSRLAFLKQSGGSSNHPELRNPIAGFDERRAEPGRALGSHTKEPAFPGGGRPCPGHSSTQGAATRQEPPEAPRLPGPSAGGWEKLVTRSPNPTSVPARRGRGMRREETQYPGRLGGGEKSAGRGAPGKTKALGGWTDLQGLRNRSARACEEEKLAAGTSYRGGWGGGKNKKEAGEREAGRDLKGLSNFKNTAKHPFQEMR